MGKVFESSGSLICARVRASGNYRYLSQAISTRKWRGIIPMGAQTRTDVLPYISLIPVFGYLWPGTSTITVLVLVSYKES